MSMSDGFPVKPTGTLQKKQRRPGDPNGFLMGKFNSQRRHPNFQISGGLPVNHPKQARGALKKSEETHMLLAENGP